MAESDEDLPDDFFDDFTNNDFLAGLGAVADPDEIDSSARRSKSNVMQEIERLERDIAERRKKLCRSPLRSRSKSIDLLDERRRRSRSRSRSHSKRRRSRSRSRSRKRGRSHRRSRSRSRHRRSRSKGRAPSKDRNISFLEELAQKFAREGKPFPEADNVARGIPPVNMMPMTMPNNYAPVPPIGNMMYPQPVPDIMHGGVHMFNQFPNPYAMAPAPAAPAPQPIDYPGGVVPIYPIPGLERDPIHTRQHTSPNRGIYQQKRSIMDDIPEIKKESRTEEMIQKSEREKTLARCRDAIESLRSLNQEPLPRRFLYTPTIIPRDAKKIALFKNKSPMIRDNNVQFFLTHANPNESQRYYTLEPFMSEIVTALGADMKTLLKVKYIPNKNDKDADYTNEMDHDGNDDALPNAWSENVGTQTEEMYCDKCITQSLKVHQHVAVQTTVARTVEQECQTMPDDTMSLSEMTPAQLRAINDFSKILRGGLAPTTYREATELRDRLYNIYQSCTGISQNLYPRDNENRIMPSRNERSQHGQSGNSGNDDNFRRDTSNSRDSDNGMLTSKQIMERELNKNSARNNPINRNRAADFFNDEPDWDVSQGGMSNSGNSNNFGNISNFSNMSNRGSSSGGGTNDPRMNQGSGNFSMSSMGQKGGNIVDPRMNNMGSGLGNLNLDPRIGSNNMGPGNMGLGNMGSGNMPFGNMGSGGNMNMGNMGIGNMNSGNMGSGNMNSGGGNMDPRLSNMGPGGNNFNRNQNQNFNNRGGNFNRGNF